MSASWRPAGDRELRIGLAGLGSMGRNHLRVIGGTPDAAARGGGRSGPGGARGGDRGDRRDGLRRAAAMVAEADLDALVIAAPDDRPPAAGPCRHRARGRGPRREATGDNGRGRLEIVAAPRSTGVPVQVGHVERFNPAVLELGRLLDGGWLSTVYAITSRRAGPFPDRIRDVGVTIDLATHDVDILLPDRRRAAGPGPGRDRPAHPRRPRGPPVRAPPFPVRRRRAARCRLADPGQAAPAVVVGEEGMFELDYLTQRLTFTRATDMTNPR